MKTIDFKLKAFVSYSDCLKCFSSYMFNAQRYIERFLSYCRKVTGIGVTSGTQYDWLAEKLAPVLVQSEVIPLRSKIKTNRDSFAHVFPRIVLLDALI